ncbi:MAG: hypothetical protein OJF51_000758 [Nitrospira sp.]|jgi:hypothetical protein|nr:MAG: hypothetical protein OJF51_000758 [Nitrospira sp.]
MDQRTNIVEQDIKDILETRLEISRKIQLLDEKARYEMENMKTTLSGLAANVAETGKEFIDRSARTLNPVPHMNGRPWAALAGIVLFGVAIGMFEKRFRRAKVYPYYAPKAHGVPVMPSEGEEESGETRSGVYPYFPGGHQEEANRSRSSFSSDLWSDVKANISAEMERSKGALGYAIREFARDMAKEVVPAILRSMGPPLSHGSRR